MVLPPGVSKVLCSMIPFQVLGWVKPSDSTKKTMPETPPSNHPRNPGRCSSKAWRAPSYTLLCYQIIDLPEKTKANELTRFTRVWSSILSHRLMQKRSHLRKHPVNSRHSSTNGRTEANPSSSLWAKTNQGSPELFLLEIIHKEPPLFKSEGFISLSLIRN